MHNQTLQRPGILDHLSVLADATRSRILVLLERRELTVSELCASLRLPQSTVSRHLRVLADSGWARSRPDGTHRLYSLAREGLGEDEGRLWDLARGHVADHPSARQDASRLDAMLATRRTRSREFFDRAGVRWDEMRDRFFGRRFYLTALLGLIDPGLTVADLGCGTGAVAEALAPFVSHLYAVDGSRAMLDAAQVRLEAATNVELRRGELEQLPLEDGSLDAATLILVLHHLSDPACVLKEVARVLRPGGRLLLVDMLPHDRQEYRTEMGHVWLGFDPELVRQLARDAGLAPGHVHALPLDSESEGPALFAATASRPPTKISSHSIS